MKKIYFLFFIAFLSFKLSATTHVIEVLDEALQFLPAEVNDIELGDTIQWLPLDMPMMTHTITSTSIPEGAASFNYVWEPNGLLFFQYVPTQEGLYEYVCLPHQSLGMVGSFQVGGVNSVVDFSEGNAVSAYPNPASTELRFTQDLGNADFSIFGLDGRLAMAGRMQKILDVSALKPGMYLVEVYGDKPRTIRFIKQ